MKIQDGQGRGYEAGVDETNRLKTLSIAVPLQHHASVNNGNAFQVIGDYTLTGAGTSTILTLSNNSSTNLLVGTYIRPQVASLAGGTFGTATYMTLNFGGQRASGGTVVSAVNMNKSSGNEADITAYDNDATLSGTLTEFDRWYPETATDEFTYNKQGALILGTNDSVSFQFVTDHTGGYVRVRMSFFLTTVEEHT